MSICKDCPNRPMCVTLCQEAKTYANQDWISLRELTVGLTPEVRAIYKADIVKDEYDNLVGLFSHLPRERQVVTLLENGLTRREICKVLNITKENLRNIIRRIRQKRNKNTN